jgi:RNA polymerase sigma factor (sigma-70 family)
VTQNVMVQLSRQFGSFQYDSSRRFRGWLRVVAHASWCEFLERRRMWDQGVGGEDASNSIDSIAARDDLTDLIEKEFAHEVLNRAMLRVEVRVERQTWQAFWMMSVEGRPGQEVANRLGMKLGSTYAACSKVRRLIREETRRDESGSS